MVVSNGCGLGKAENRTQMLAVMRMDLVRSGSKLLKKEKAGKQK
jgi:hypothetical protein